MLWMFLFLAKRLEYIFQSGTITVLLTKLINIVNCSVLFLWWIYCAKMSAQYFQSIPDNLIIVKTCCQTMKLNPVIIL